MEKISSGAIINGINYLSGKEIHGTAYEEFIRWRPNIYALKDAWYALFEDAVRSLVLNTESVAKVRLDSKVDAIVELAVKYAKIYFKSADGDKALYIFNGALKDVVRSYQYTDLRYNDLVDGLYAKICDLLYCAK